MTAHVNANHSRSYRRHPRVDADVYINKIIDDHPYLVRVRDISVSGMFIYRLIEPKNEGNSEFGFELRLPNCDDTIWAVGRMVRDVNAVTTEGCAVEFVRMGERDRQLIRAYVAERLTQNLVH
jgi:c-di-GMP-binding flagellar brake protein YcgR